MNIEYWFRKLNYYNYSSQSITFVFLYPRILNTGTASISPRKHVNVRRKRGTLVATTAARRRNAARTMAMMARRSFPTSSRRMMRKKLTSSLMFS